MTSTTGLVPATGPTVATFIKTDVLGRLQRTREQRERILDEYRRSGLSGRKFAALCGVKYQTFATWLQRRKRQRKCKPRRRANTQVQWLEALVQPSALDTAPGLLLRLPGGVHTRISNDQHIQLAAALVRALEKSC